MVVGAGIAGLCSAAALARHCRQVILLDKDRLGNGQVRRGAPQGAHIHQFQIGALQRIEEQFKGFTERAMQQGAAGFEWGPHTRLFTRGEWSEVRGTGIQGLSLTRPLLERLLLSEVLRIPNLELREKQRVSALDTDACNRVSGLTIKKDGRNYRQDTDLVIDATGRGCQSRLWMRQLGLPLPRQERIHIDLCYTSCLWSIPDPWRDEVNNWAIRNYERHSRGATLFRVERDQWIASFSGRCGDFAEATVDGMRQFAASLDRTQIADRIATAESASPPVQFRFRENRRNRFETAAHLPVGLIPVGDVLASQNPLWGQGMSLSTVHAQALEAALIKTGNRDVRRLTAAYWQEVLPYVDYGWCRAAAADMEFSGTSGDLPDLERFLARERAFLEAAASDYELRRLNLLVAHFARSPSALDLALARLGREY